jgi:RimJ/RimL family protein N-acetyltransferase
MGGQASAWPLFDLVVRTPELELRYATDDLLLALTIPHRDVLGDSGDEPFDGESSFYESPPKSERKFLTGEWGARAKTSPTWWHLSFAVIRHGEPVGMQDITGVEFPTVRTVNSFSWLARSARGIGLGKEMRTAILHLAFEGLGALRAESDAFDDNAASGGVSRALGYEPNGSLLASRPSGAAPMSRFLMTREAWRSSAMCQRADIEIHGLAPCLALLGLDGPGARD